MVVALSCLPVPLTLAQARPVPPSPVPPSPVPPSPVSPIPPGAGVDRDLRELVATLNDDQQPQARRDEAARRLASRASAQARAALLAALVNLANPRAQLAAARAVSSDGSETADPAFITPLNALLGPDRQLTEAAAAALADYTSRPEVITLLIQFFQNKANAEGSRSAVARALGGGAGSAEKRVAATLLAVLLDTADSPVVRGAAADALAELASHREYGRDTARWRRWWDEQANVSDAAFRDAVLSRRAALLEIQQARNGALPDELANLLAQQQRGLSEADRDAMLSRLLRSTLPAVRVAGARIIYGDALENRTVPPGVREVLRQLVGDSAPDVRLEVVSTLRVLNDATAIDALLTQLPQESDPDVRAAIAATLGPIRDVRATAALLSCLDDVSVRVAAAAAESLAALGPEIRRDASLTETVALALRRTLDTRTAPHSDTPDPPAPSTPAGNTGSVDDLRGALIEALTPLRRRELLPLLQSLLRPSESARVRRAALRGLAELHEPDSALAIISALEDSSAGAHGGGGGSASGSVAASVRMEAVNALGAIPTFDHAETLYRRLNPDVEPDPAVQARAWSVLLELFPLATRQRLFEWADRFKDQPERRLGVLRALQRKLTSPGDEEQLALTQQLSGECLLALDRPAEAATDFREALNYWRSRPIAGGAGGAAAGAAAGGGMYKEGLYQSTIDALLRARLFPAAVQFASASIADSPENQQTMGPRLRTEVQRLLETGDRDSAQLLLTEIRRMQNPLAPRYLEDLTALEAQPGPPARAAPPPPTTSATSVSVTPTASSQAPGASTVPPTSTPPTPTPPTTRP